MLSSHKSKGIFVAFCFVLMALLQVTLFAAQASEADPFFKGKTVRIVVHTNPGGGYDIYSRLVARHLSRFIPGEPTIIVQNMLGAAGLIATNYVYNRGSRDGTVVLAAPWQFPIRQLIGERGVQYEVQKMRSLGSLDFKTNGMFTRKDRFPSFNDLLQSGKLARLASSGPGDTSNTTGKVIEAVVGKKMFQYIMGYGSGREQALAVKRGEADGIGFQLDVIKLYLTDMWKGGEIVAVVQVGRGGKPHPELPDSPLLSELAQTSESKKIAKLMYPALTFGRGYWLPPEVPDGRVELLRGAFGKLMHDPKFLAEAEKLGRDISPMPAEELEGIWNEMFESPPEVVDLYKEIFTPRK